MENTGVLPPNISTALDVLKMHVEMIPDQECVTTGLVDDCTTNKLEID